MEHLRGGRRQGATTEGASRSTKQGTERNGIQWHVVAPGLGVFAASAVLTFAGGDASSSAGTRAVTALESAFYILVMAMFLVGCLRVFVRQSRLSSPLLFLVVWIVAMAIWIVHKPR